MCTFSLSPTDALQTRQTEPWRWTQTTGKKRKHAYIAYYILKHLNKNKEHLCSLSFPRESLNSNVTGIKSAEVRNFTHLAAKLFFAAETHNGKTDLILALGSVFDCVKSWLTVSLAETRAQAARSQTETTVRITSALRAPPRVCETVRPINAFSNNVLIEKERCPHNVSVHFLLMNVNTLFFVC